MKQQLEKWIESEPREWRIWSEVAMHSVVNGPHSADGILVVEKERYDALAAELERYKAERQVTRTSYIKALYAEIEKLKADNAILKSALDKVIKADAEYSSNEPGVSRLKHCVLIARDALTKIRNMKRDNKKT